MCRTPSLPPSLHGACSADRFAIESACLEFGLATHKVKVGALARIFLEISVLRMGSGAVDQFEPRVSKIVVEESVVAVVCRDAPIAKTGSRCTGAAVKANNRSVVQIWIDG